jgi:hypothetical protein
MECTFVDLETLAAPGPGSRIQRLKSPSAEAYFPGPDLPVAGHFAFSSLKLVTELSAVTGRFGTWTGKMRALDT